MKPIPLKKLQKPQPSFVAGTMLLRSYKAGAKNIEITVLF